MKKAGNLKSTLKATVLITSLKTLIILSYYPVLKNSVYIIYINEELFVTNSAN